MARMRNEAKNWGQSASECTFVERSGQQDADNDGRFNITYGESTKSQLPSILGRPLFASKAKELSEIKEPDMATVSKEVFDARLEAIEARMDARVAGMASKLDTALAEMRADREANNVRFSAMTRDVDEIKSDLKTASSESKAQAASIKGSVWAAAVATITIVGATMALTLASFDSGRETSKNLSEATARMEKIQAQLEAAAKLSAPPIQGKK